MYSCAVDLEVEDKSGHLERLMPHVEQQALSHDK
jgi:hypothetical protein